MTVDEMAEMSKAKRAQATQMREAAIALVPTIIDIVAVEVAAWSRMAARAFAERYFSNNPSDRLGLMPKVPALRTALQQLEKDIPELVSSELKKQRWSHDPVPDADSLTPPATAWTEGNVETEVWPRIATILYGFVGRVLDEHGFLAAKPSFSPDGWSRDTRRTPPRYVYTYTSNQKPPAPDAVKTVLETYQSKLSAAYKLDADADLLDRSRARETFATVWPKD